jgi:glyoxylase-like metal-dependent hydrolase (beta-lactamase superfamily II)
MKTKIYPIHTHYDTVYIVAGESVILVDAGDPGTFEKVKVGLQTASVKPEEVRLIVLTHGHWDHVGGAKEIKDLTGAPILAHQKDIDLPGVFPPAQPPGFTTWGKVIIAGMKLMTRSNRVLPFGVDIVAGDDDVSLVDYGIPGKVVYTPGHSPGSISVVLESGEAFVGDLALNMFPLRFTPGLPIFGDDMQVIKNSWRRLRSMGVKVVYPAHGKAFPADVIYKLL